jgi:hypothetical protein
MLGTKEVNTAGGREARSFTKANIMHAFLFAAVVALQGPAPANGALSMTMERGNTGNPGDELITRSLPDGTVQILQYPYDPAAIKVTLTNVSDKTVKMAFFNDPRAGLDFVVDMNGRNVTRKGHYGDDFSPSSSPTYLTLAPKQSHCFYVSVMGVIVPEEVGPGTYTVHGSFTYGKDTTKSTRAYTFKGK